MPGQSVPMCRSVLIVFGFMLLGLKSPAEPRRVVPPVDPEQRTITMMVVNDDPVVRGHANARLSRHFIWNNPRLLTTNLIRHLREVSGGFANYRLVDFIDVDAFPKKRDGYRY